MLSAEIQQSVENRPDSGWKLKLYNERIMHRSLGLILETGHSYLSNDRAKNKAQITIYVAYLVVNLI